MRRGTKIQYKNLILLFIAAIFNLISFSLDQLVVQKEDDLRATINKLNTQKSEVDTLQYSINNINNLKSKITKDKISFTDSLEFNTTIIELLNLDIDIIKNLRDEDIDLLRLHYKNDLYELIYSINSSIDEFKTSSQAIFKNKLIEDLLLSSDWFSLPEFQNKVTNLNINKLSDKLLENYDFYISKKSKDGSKIAENNYIIYTKIDNLIDQTFSFYDKNNMERSYVSGLESTANYLTLLYTDKFIKYYYVVDEYADIKNLNNYFILFSISFQILGITFLLLLFKSLVGVKVND